MMVKIPSGFVCAACGQVNVFDAETNTILGMPGGGNDGEGESKVLDS